MCDRVDHIRPWIKTTLQIAYSDCKSCQHDNPTFLSELQSPYTSGSQNGIERPPGFHEEKLEQL